MDITKVTLRPVAMNKVCAIASVVIDDQFVVHDLRVVNGDKGLFVAMPSRKLPNGEFRDICHPINSEARQHLQEAVLDQFRVDGGLEYFLSAQGEALDHEHPDYDQDPPHREPSPTRF
jgi:stage V sporulation protein G